MAGRSLNRKSLLEQSILYDGWKRFREGYEVSNMAHICQEIIPAGARENPWERRYSSVGARSGTAGAASLRQSAARRISQTMSAAVRSQIATITAAAIFPTRVALPTISSDF